MSQYPEIVCYQGIMLATLLITIFCAIIFALISTIVNYAFYEPRMTSCDIKSRAHSQGDLAYILNKVFS